MRVVCVLWLKGVGGRKRPFCACLGAPCENAKVALRRCGVEPDDDDDDPPTCQGNGGSTSYYMLPDGATELNDLIEAKQMSFALGNIFKACYRFGEKSGVEKEYDINKIIYFAEWLRGMVQKGLA